MKSFVCYPIKYLFVSNNIYVYNILTYFAVFMNNKSFVKVKEYFIFHFDILISYEESILSHLFLIRENLQSDYNLMGLCV